MFRQESYKQKDAFFVRYMFAVLHNNLNALQNNTLLIVRKPPLTKIICVTRFNPHNLCILLMHRHYVLWLSQKNIQLPTSVCRIHGLVFLMEAKHTICNAQTES
jgi:hypothetical protein